ncbi:hypothetical protein JL720_13850 [Aureococcus anophagefferens]|nr:hypothetical protein JL720_13850 [Aureococcus anophagefferens]
MAAAARYAGNGRLEEPELYVELPATTLARCGPEAQSIDGRAHIKERRLAKRAAAREAAGAKQPSDATTKPPAAAVRRRPHGEGAAQAQARRRARRGGAGADKDDVGLRRRGRRRHVQGGARRSAPRRGEAAAARRVPSGEPSSAPLVAFVGQLGFSVTAERLKAFFTSQDVPGTLKVRLLTDAKTGKSRGMAFVQCETAEALYACVALHHAQIDGRRINVERSAGGGREAKKGKLAEHRAHQSKRSRRPSTACSRSSSRRASSGATRSTTACAACSSGAAAASPTRR